MSAPDPDLNNGRPAIWSAAVPPGGMVCAAPDRLQPDGICGRPVESEPCDRHEPPATATPGQAAYEARYRNFATDEDWSPPPWPDLTDEERADWEAAAAAVMLMAQATVDYAELQELRAASGIDRERLDAGDRSQDGRRRELTEQRDR